MSRIIYIFSTFLHFVCSCIYIICSILLRPLATFLLLIHIKHMLYEKDSILPLCFFVPWANSVHISLLRIDSTTGNLATRQLHTLLPRIRFVPKLLETRVSSIQANYKYSNFERRVNDDIAALRFKGISLRNKYTRTSQIVKSFERHSPFIVSVYPRHSPVRSINVYIATWSKFIFRKLFVERVQANFEELAALSMKLKLIRSANVFTRKSDARRLRRDQVFIRLSFLTRSVLVVDHVNGVHLKRDYRLLNLM